MKRIFAVLAAVLLIAGAAGPAMAAFELGNMQLVAYSNTTGLFPIPNSGTESHFDLGANIDAYIDGSIGSFSEDTLIGLDDLSAGSWDQVYVSVFGGGRYQNFQPAPMAFTSTDDSVLVGNYNAFGSASSQYWQGNTNYFATDADGNKTGAMSTAFSYWATMDQSGTGIAFAGSINSASAEIQLTDGTATINMFGLEDASSYTPTLIGTWTLDATGGTLVASYQAVPVPAAVWLLGSGLLGLIGIRRRNA